VPAFPDAFNLATPLMHHDEQQQFHSAIMVMLNCGLRRAERDASLHLFIFVPFRAASPICYAKDAKEGCA
jgi:hypothetical protein